MTRVMPSPVSFLARRVGGRALPWLTVLEAARTIYRRGQRGWRELSASEQAEMRRILREARDAPGAVSPRDRSELRRIVFKALRKAASPL